MDKYMISTDELAQLINSGADIRIVNATRNNPSFKEDNY
jgi:hypothetical protein